MAGLVALHALDAFVTPPPRLPDLWTIGITTYSCAHFGLLYILSALPRNPEPQKAKQQ